MIVALVWNWYEIVEGAVVSLAFVVVPLLWRIERHHKELRRHAEHQTLLAEETHYMQHTGEPHPRVKERLRRTGTHTPERATC